MTFRLPRAKISAHNQEIIGAGDPKTKTNTENNCQIVNICRNTDLHRIAQSIMSVKVKYLFWGRGIHAGTAVLVKTFARTLQRFLLAVPAESSSGRYGKF